VTKNASDAPGTDDELTRPGVSFLLRPNCAREEKHAFMGELSAQGFPLFDIALLDPQIEGVPGWASLLPNSPSSVVAALARWIQAHPAVHRLRTQDDFEPPAS
jgi:hypothetical protein